jgi:hypothetical protein
MARTQVKMQLCLSKDYHKSHAAATRRRNRPSLVARKGRREFSPAILSEWRPFLISVFFGSEDTLLEREPLGPNSFCRHDGIEEQCSQSVHHGRRSAEVVQPVGEIAGGTFRSAVDRCGRARPPIPHLVLQEREQHEDAEKPFLQFCPAPPGTRYPLPTCSLRKQQRVPVFPGTRIYLSMLMNGVNPMPPAMKVSFVPAVRVHGKIGHIVPVSRPDRRALC